MPSQPRAANEPVILVLRVYRQESARVSGVLEDPRTGVRRAFTAADQLWDLILAAGASEPSEPTDRAPSKTHSKEIKP